MPPLAKFRSTRFRKTHDDARHAFDHRRRPTSHLIDSPGLQEFGSAISTAKKSNTLPRIPLILASARFRDCRHNREPDCVLRAAVVKAGNIEKSRFAVTTG